MSAAVTLKDIKNIIRETAGEVVAEKFAEARKVDRRNTDHLMGKGRAFKLTPTSEKPVEELTSDEKSLMAARCVRYLFAANGDPVRAIDMAAANGDKTIADTWDKALGETTLAGGGALLPVEFSEAIIEALGAKTVVRKMGVGTMPMNTGSLTMSFEDTTSTAAYVGESTNITKSEPTFGQLQLSDKKLAALVPASNDLLRNGGARVDRHLRDSIVRVMRRKEDVTFIRSDGSSNEPKGMLFWAVSGNKFNANGTVNVANVTIDLGTAVRKLEDSDVDLDGRPGWLISPRSKQYLMTARDGNGNLVWEPEMKNGTIMSYPFAVTTQIPINLGGGTNESEVYFAAFDSLLIAENDALRIEVFPGGAYYDGSSVQSGISRDETPIRAIALHDFGALQRGKEIAVIQAVKWGV